MMPATTAPSGGSTSLGQEGRRSGRILRKPTAVVPGGGSDSSALRGVIDPNPQAGSMDRMPAADGTGGGRMRLEPRLRGDAPFDSLGPDEAATAPDRCPLGLGSSRLPQGAGWGDRIDATPPPGAWVVGPSCPTRAGQSCRRGRRQLAPLSRTCPTTRCGGRCGCCRSHFPPARLSSCPATARRQPSKRTGQSRHYGESNAPFGRPPYWP